MTEIKNSIRFTPSEIKKIEDRVDYVIKKYNIKSKIRFIDISKRLKTSAGIIKWQHDKYANEYFNFSISLAYNHYQEFGFKETMETLNHELAHFVAVLVHNHRGHGDIFKKICVELGGTMNPRMAGTKYKQAASTNFCKTSYKWKYTCTGCDKVVKRKRRISKKILVNNACITCNTRLMDWKVEQIW